MAFDIHPGDAKDVDALGRNGWRVVDPRSVVATPEEYRAFIHGSRAEFMVPKHMYVATRSGLLSDRSAYYLASGRPVLARDTGLAGSYPVGKGLLTFTTPEEAAEGVRQIRADYHRHARAARAIAEEQFDSDKVLRRLLDQLGVRTS
jgi:glycosyltransferase involved in cell wall biosynthesis